jgi:LysM repeat protein
MPIDRALPSDGIPEATQFAEAQRGVPVELQSQLSSPKDISAATNFFKPSSANSFLPDMPLPKGVEATAMLPPGAESALGVPAMPGAEQVSPLINMITKMPGHMSLLSNFFEFLGSFFGGPDLLSAFDQGLGGDLLGGVMDGAGDHLGIDLSLLPDDAPILETLGDAGGFDSALGDATTGSGSPDWFSSASRPLGDSFAHAPSLNVGGGADVAKPMFEKGFNINFDPNNHFRDGSLVAMDPTGGFSSTITPMPATPQAVPDNSHLLQQSPAPQGQTVAPGTDGAMDNAGSGGEGNTDAQSDATSADASTETVSYKVQSGDNLWDIAGKHFGDSTRWGEIYKLNEGLIGQNPRLIMPGTELQLPGGAENIASANAGGEYTVQSGDNLWDISKEHLGGGENWKDLYSNNMDVVGKNPDLIHPGQHLQMNGAGDHSHLAGSNHLSSAAGVNHGAPAVSHHAPSVSHHTAGTHATGNHTANLHQGGHPAANHHAANNHVAKSDVSAGHAAPDAVPAANPPQQHIAQAASPQRFSGTTAPVELEAQATTMSITD